MLVSKGAHVDLRAAIQESAQLQPLQVSPTAEEEVVDFLQRRLEQMLVSPAEIAALSDAEGLLLLPQVCSSPGLSCTQVCVQ